MRGSMRIRSRIAIRCAKITAAVIRKLNRGSGVTLPGYVARKIDPKILSVMSEMVREKIIVTTGTNGKTTTNSILAHVLKAEGKKVVFNRTGSNMQNGIISTFVLETDKKGRLDADYACIEVDENASVGVFPQLKPDGILLTNLSRDQLDRFGEVDITRGKIKKAVLSVPEAKFILNCDDVLSYSLAQECKNPVVTYGINEQIFDDISRSEIRESIFCRACGKKLEYEFFHYGQLGIYHCQNCGFSHPTPDYAASKIEYSNETYSFEIDGIFIDSGAGSPYNVYNTLSAYAALGAINAPHKRFKEAVESFDYRNNRESVFQISGARVQLHLAKNPIGFQQKISLLLKDPSPKDVVIQINDAVQDGTDISWLWDVDFQYLADSNVASITTAGTRRYDMGLRLKYEDIESGVTEELEETVKTLAESGTGNLYIIVNYTGLYRTNHMLSVLADA